ncbi:MAG TPA: cation-translocating P-type ATPase [Candidatus Egerieicola pullicola]|uniref:P-type Ca(2+) transporter n=1 Tax=Candidatus Egerieicola pullicola TaxID=2840775 RepID=A0A9D1AIT1_9FIRM|nr:cation-translocating P-type ATPase [Candidatus Egerieicola pullicola]
MKQDWNCSAQELFDKLDSGQSGLSQAQVEAHQQVHGLNQLQEKKKKSVFMVFLSQFADMLVIVLLVAALISMVTGNLESTLVILAVLIMNAVLGTVQHVKAEKSLEGLKAMSAPNARVLRDGKEMSIPSKEVTVGDIVLLEAGDLVPADGRIIESASLKVNESALTGESEGVEKTDQVLTEENPALGDRKNMAYSSSLVLYGRGKLLVIAVGMGTEIGKIASLMEQTKERQTPLQKTLDQFSKKLSIGIMIVCLAVFVINLFHGMNWLDSLLFAVALAVAAIPEALSSIVTIALAIGTSKMAKQHAIMKKLQAVEGLGCVSVICSDKTGTLTQNRMTVTDSYALDKSQKNLLMEASVLCNDSYVDEEKELGDPTETALKQWYRRERPDLDAFLAAHPKVFELPFDSDRKLMSVLVELDGKMQMFTKGAVDVMSARITQIEEQGQCRPVTQQDLEQIASANQAFSEQGLRVLCFGYREVAGDTLTLEDETDFTFLGLVAMMDPPRPESKQAVADCIRAGIKPVMITGDHVTTASAIASQIGILQEGDRAITGAELDAMSDEELAENLEQISVYARVSPEHKIRIVQQWQAKHRYVAMTGDGVNDAPALKQADVGVAMGITGTEVSKDAASMILTDDNFATIVQAVANGRAVYQNIKNAIKFLLSGNAAGILCVLFCSIAGLVQPFTTVQLLFINLLTDSLPALAIAMEPGNRDLLGQKPRDSRESLLTKDFLRDVGLQGVLIAIATMCAFFFGLQTSPEVACTMSFATICLARLWYGFCCRGNQSLVRLGFLTNKYSIGAFLLGAALLACVLLIPGLEGLFDVAGLAGVHFGVIVGFSIIPSIIVQIWRLITEAIKSRKEKKQ